VASLASVALQRGLQQDHPGIAPAEPNPGFRADAYACSHAVRPEALLTYEHMFCSSRTSPLAQRALGALRLTRSFLLLEDDYDVDWEVDPNEHLQAPHPHRAPLRGRTRVRRQGQPAPTAHVCLCPVEGSRAASRPRRPGDRTGSGSSR
jgi:hypothetical protein